MIDWGNVPDWVGAIGTSGSLLLGFSLLYRDRLQHERRDAELVLCSLTWDERRQYVEVANASSRLVQETTVYYVEPRDDQHPPLPGLYRRRTPLGPGERERLATNAADGRYLKPVFITFRDTDGRYWMRFLGDRSDLIRIGRSSRRYQRLVAAHQERIIASMYRSQIERQTDRGTVAGTGDPEATHGQSRSKPDLRPGNSGVGRDPQ